MDERHWLPAVKKINGDKEKLGGLILSMATTLDKLKPQTISLTGTLFRMHHPVRAAKKVQFIAEGLRRFKIVEWLTTEQPFHVKIEYPPLIDAGDNSALYTAYALNIINTLKEMMKYNPIYSEELKFFLNRFTPEEPEPLCDFAASMTSSNKQELQSILDTYTLHERMERVLIIAKRELEMVKLQAQIRQDVEAKMTEHQRKFFLKQQLKTIQQELGISKDDKTADRDIFEKRLEKLTIPSIPKQRIDNELHKLSILESGSPEYAVTRNYLEVITSLPWGKVTVDNFNLKHATRSLNSMHEGLDDIKKRICEFIAVGALKGNISGSIILLVGPPGVGKTSIGRSIAQALNRRFYRFSVGGMRDEAEIKGHRKTYIGAMPGKLIQAIRESASMNPVILIDEIDKMGNSHQGDPASALLEVLDPEQNNEFLDHYLDLRFDLSNVLFICTANELSNIPQPLLDRMEIMRLAGYITEEKLAIATKHLWPKNLQKHGISASQLTIQTSALQKIIDDYAREAGVRQLEKKIAEVMRKAAVRLLKNPNKTIHITEKEIVKYLGQARFVDEKPINTVGTATGLAWTSLGGATLTIETTSIQDNQQGLKLTGKLGDVMKESAIIAHSFVLANGEKYDCETFFKDRTLHCHAPEGATPKDGPSAGITLVTAFLSLAKNKSVPRKLAMTGEVTLTGQVLAVGGIREKIIAARRAHIEEIILPIACKSEYATLPLHLRKNLKIHFVNHYDEVYKIAFGRLSQR